MSIKVQRFLVIITIIIRIYITKYLTEKKKIKLKENVSINLINDLCVQLSHIILLNNRFFEHLVIPRGK